MNPLRAGRALAASAVSVCLIACGGSQNHSGGGGAGGVTSSTGSGGTMGTGGSGSGTTSTPIQGMFAAGISVTDVEVNQGVGIAVVTAGALVAPADRTAPIIGQRHGLVRVSWALDSGFSPRDIEAQVTLTDSQGKSTLLQQTRMVSGPPDPTQLDGTFHWDVDGSIDRRRHHLLGRAARGLGERQRPAGRGALPPERRRGPGRRRRSDEAQGRDPARRRHGLLDREFPGARRQRSGHHQRPALEPVSHQRARGHLSRAGDAPGLGLLGRSRDRRRDQRDARRRRQERRRRGRRVLSRDLREPEPGSLRHRRLFVAGHGRQHRGRSGGVLGRLPELRGDERCLRPRHPQQRGPRGRPHPWAATPLGGLELSALRSGSAELRASERVRLRRLPRAAPLLRVDEGEPVRAPGGRPLPAHGERPGLAHPAHEQPRRQQRPARRHLSVRRQVGELSREPERHDGLRLSVLDQRVHLRGAGHAHPGARRGRGGRRAQAAHPPGRLPARRQRAVAGEVPADRDDPPGRREEPGAPQSAGGLAGSARRPQAERRGRRRRRDHPPARRGSRRDARGGPWDRRREGVRGASCRAAQALRAQ